MLKQLFKLHLYLSSWRLMLLLHLHFHMFSLTRFHVHCRTRILIVFILLLGNNTLAKKIEPSSTLLRMHKYYTLFPPHETSLYDTLQVLPNATAADISKQYRKLTRQLHPDKKRHQHKTKRHHDDDTNTTSSSRNTDECTDPDIAAAFMERKEEEDTQQRLFQVQTAYEVLKQDVTRLIYHQYGLLDTGSAAAILTGCKVGHLVDISPLQLRLMEWMGYSNESIYETTWREEEEDHHPPHRRYSTRVMLIAIRLVELIRPVVEGTLSQEYLAHEIAKECHALKSLPLGAQILRCIGRAYRHCGKRYLRRYRTSSAYIWKTTRQYRKNNPLQMATLDITDSLHVRFRNVKSLATAAIASGRLLLEESVYSLRKKQYKGKHVGSIEYPDLGHTPLDDLEMSHSFDGDEIRETEEEKAHQAVINSLQVEALWKIAKIDLDKTIQEACQVILQGEYFFFPSYQSTSWDYAPSNVQGWVASNGQAIEVSIGKLRAAAAMILIGDIMVQSSKERTSWVD